jgi:beta-alanine degradation protein BauB
MTKLTDDTPRTDPARTDPDKYHVLFENERVRVLEYLDVPGDQTQPHQHPDSVMYTLSGFERRLHGVYGSRDVAMEPGSVHWLPAQTHAGENTGSTITHVLFVELKS